MAGQSGRQTNISKHRLGCRLPHESSDIGTGYASPGPVVQYTLSQEEIIQRYGPVQQTARNISAKSLEWAIKKAKTPRDAAVLLNISKTYLWQKINEFEVEIPEEWEAEMPMRDIKNNPGTASDTKAKKSREDIAREKLTRKVYDDLQAQDMSDLKIMKQLGVANDVFYKIKKEWGLTQAGRRAQTKHPVKDQTPSVKPQVIWIPKDARYEIPIVTVENRFRFNTVATKILAMEHIRVGVLDGKLIVAPGEQEDISCYKLHVKDHAATIGGNKLLEKLKEAGLALGKYQLTKDDQNGWWVGEKIESA